MIVGSALLVILVFTSRVHGQYASRFPLAIPLFHKSPYLNAWLPANTSTYNQVPTAMEFVDLTIAVRVDSSPYLLQGQNQPNYVAAKTIGAYITSTRTVLTMDAGPLRVNITYLTPTELNDWILHSLPFVYFFIDFWSTDSRPHSIQLYTSVGGTFLSFNRDNKMTWNTTTTAKAIYHRAQQSIIKSFAENHDMAEDGTQYFATGLNPGAALTWQTATFDIARDNFSSTGKLKNSADTNFRSIDNGWTSMAFALDFGSIAEISQPPVFVLGLVRDPVIMYGTQSASPLWRSKWKNAEQAIDALLTNFPVARSRAIALDNKIVDDATAMSSSIGLPPAAATNLTDLMILSLRQTIGSLEFTTVKSSNGHSAEKDGWRVFMKDLGSTGRVNPVDNLYASFPAFLYLDSSLSGKLLEPLLESQVSSTDIYAAPDLGEGWPIVTGNKKDQFYLGVESSGSMLVMALAHARKSGDGSLIAMYHDRLRNWADFLVNNSNSLQLLNGYRNRSADWVNGTSNVVLKGIMGIHAMGEINKVLGRDPTHYLDTASNYIQEWQSNALTSDHVMAEFGNTSSWGLLFNLYDARLLGVNIIPQTIYDTQASWYASQIPKAPRFGLPFDSGKPDIIKAPWTLFTAASIFNNTNSTARDALIGMVHSKSFQISAAVRYDANPSTYLADSGNMTTGVANPAMGGTFAFLALNVPDLPIRLPSPSVRSISTIVGGVVGGLAALIIISITAYLLFRRRKRRMDMAVDHRPPIDEVRPIETPTPFHVYEQPEVIETSPTEFPQNPPPYSSHTSFDRKILLAPNPSSFASVLGSDRIG